MVKTYHVYVPGLPWGYLGQFYIRGAAPQNCDYPFSVRVGDLNRGWLLEACDRLGYVDGDRRREGMVKAPALLSSLAFVVVHGTVAVTWPRVIRHVAVYWKVCRHITLNIQAVIAVSTMKKCQNMPRIPQ